MIIINTYMIIINTKIIKDNTDSYSDFWKFVKLLQSFMKEKRKEVTLTVKDDGRESIEFSMDARMYKEFIDKWEESLK